MSRRKHIFAALILGVLVLALRASADDATLEASPAKTNKTAFNASLRAGETVGIHQIQRAFLNIGTNQIAFMVPGGFSMNASDSQKIVLTDNASDYFITVRVSSLPQTEAGSETSYFRGVALSRFPGAKITDESSDFVANHSGPAFQLQWLNSNGSPESARISFIPSAAGVLEFSVMARSADFKDARIYLDILLSSVRNNESGKLVIDPLPDFS